MTSAALTSLPTTTINVRLIALDLDGTTLGTCGTVRPRTREAIAKLVDAGVHVCIATGRCWWECREVLEGVAVSGLGVFTGGAVVNDMLTGDSHGHSRMDLAVAREVCRVIDANGITAMVTQDRCHADVEWLIAAERDMPHSMPEWIARHGSSYRRAANLHEATHEWTVRISTIASREQHTALAAALTAALGERVYLHEIIVPGTGVSVLEIFDAGVNKWHGIRRVAESLGISENQIVAVGDDMNDIQMLKHAALGVAMGNARAEVIAAADRTIGSNADDGLAEFLETLLANGLTVRR